MVALELSRVEFLSKIAEDLLNPDNPVQGVAHVCYGVAKEPLGITVFMEKRNVWSTGPFMRCPELTRIKELCGDFGMSVGIYLTKSDYPTTKFYNNSEEYQCYLEFKLLWAV